jgi:hypothetical protein
MNRWVVTAKQERAASPFLAPAFLDLPYSVTLNHGFLSVGRRCKNRFIVFSMGLWIYLGKKNDLSKNETK